MDILLHVFSHPFVWGLLVGLVFAAWAFFAGWSARRSLRREVMRLEDHCRTAAEVAAKGNKTLMAEVDELKNQNRNLQITVAELKNKPDRAELQKLYVLDKAAALMTERAPGFAGAWQAALKEAQAEMDKTTTGLIPWLRRIVRPSLGASAPRPLPPPDGEAPRGS
jgi:acyl-CoA-binding protein